jgi:hypothetical protein
MVWATTEDEKKASTRQSLINRTVGSPNQGLPSVAKHLQRKMVGAKSLKSGDDAPPASPDLEGNVASPRQKKIKEK